MSAGAVGVTALGDLVSGGIAALVRIAREGREDERRAAEEQLAQARRRLDGSTLDEWDADEAERLARAKNATEG